MRSAALTLALLIILSGAAPATALVPTGVDGGQEPAPATALASGPALAQVDSDQPGAALRIELEPDTDARWTVTYRYPLADENEVDAFRALGEEFENGQADIAFDADVFRTISAAATETTGRAMAIRDVEREASIERNVTTTTANATPSPTTTTTPSATTTPAANGSVTGVLRLSFTWTNFLERTGENTLQLGDVFETSDGGTWLSSLGPDQRLTVVTPDGYVISRTSFPVQTQNGSLVIDGPREFTESERLVVTYRASDQAELPWTLIAGGGVAAVVLALLVYLVFGRRRSAPSGASPNGTAVTNGGETTADAGDPGPDGGTVAETDPSTATPTRAGPDEGGVGDDVDRAEHSADDAETDTDDAGDGDSEPDFDLLSDEERVEYLLEQRGGRMKQANIVKETGWSDAKVSQLLSSMAESGRVEKLRLGRENLISIPDGDEANE